jgi:hypothetical protein
LSIAYLEEPVTDPDCPPSETDTVAVRLFARWTDDSTECPLAFDLVLEPTSGRVLGDWPIFGAADYEAQRPRAFVLDATGRLDFGGGGPVWRTDLRDAALGVGRRFRIWWTEEDWSFYEVVKIAALGRKSARLRFASRRPDRDP